MADATLEGLSLAFGFTSFDPDPDTLTLTVVGFVTPQECQYTFDIWSRSFGSSPGARRRRARGEGPDQEQALLERLVTGRLRTSGFLDWSWAQPPE